MMRLRQNAWSKFNFWGYLFTFHFSQLISWFCFNQICDNQCLKNKHSCLLNQIAGMLASERVRWASLKRHLSFTLLLLVLVQAHYTQS